jgi:Arylsulfotransferase (ASST)
MWAANFNNASTMGAVMRVAMDGLDDPETISIRARNHDLAFLPNGHLLYWEQQNGGGYTNGKEGPDTIREMDPDTMVVTDIYDEMTDFADQINNSAGAHTNQVNYIPELEAISFSMRHTSTIALISYPVVKLLAVFGGPITTFSNMDWTIQHGHDVHADHLWIFNNQATSGASAVLGFDYDLATKTATPTLTYANGLSSGAFGDVKEQPNGNLYVTYSTAGVFHEITQTGELLREVTTTASCGYSEHRATLYGAPPPYAAP